MPKAVNLTESYAMRKFYKESPKRLGLWGTLIASNLAWLGVMVVLCSSMIGLSKFANHMTASYLREKWEFSQERSMTAKELAEREMKIARLIAYQTSSPVDVLQLAKKISLVIDSAPSRHRAFFERALPEAMSIQVTYGIPASAVMAMAIYESGYGRSMLAAQHHNYFGIKAFHTWQGPRAENIPTRDSGVPTQADFRAYPSLRDGFIGYAQFLRETNRYARAFRTTTGVEFVRQLLAAGYCPDESYLDNIRRIMQRHKLMELDKVLDFTATATTIAMKNAQEVLAEVDLEGLEQAP